MKLIREMSLVKDRVKALLVKHPHLRDDDYRLFATIWKFDLLRMREDPLEITGERLLFLYSDQQLTNAETIRRVRQKIQEENPELRGTVDDKRKQQAEEIRHEIKRSS